MEIVNAEKKHFPEILRLNEELVQYLSPMDEARLDHLYNESALHLVVEGDGVGDGAEDGTGDGVGDGDGGGVLAFLLAFREGADYDSVNYQWFENHYEKFLYIDRVVVDSLAQGHGIGNLIYDYIFSYARANDIPFVTAEIDIQPANPISLKYHEKYGFKEVGRQEVANGKKVVSLQISQLL